MKKFLLTFILAITLVSASFANKDTIMVSTPTQVYHYVAGTPVLSTSITVNVGDTIVVQNWSTITADFTMNTTSFRLYVVLCVHFSIKFYRQMLLTF